MATKNGSEPRNPLYLLLLVVGVVFVMTALADALIPVLEQKAIDAGRTPPSSEIRDELRSNGWKWLLVEVAILIIVALASMILDRLRSLQKERAANTIPPEKPPGPSP